jgi:hypothetical protein
MFQPIKLWLVIIFKHDSAIGSTSQLGDSRRFGLQPAQFGFLATAVH